MDKLKICSRCICDTTIPEIQFDENGVCQFCKMHDEMTIQYPTGEERERKLSELISNIKKSGKKRDYDCIVLRNVFRKRYTFDQPTNSKQI